jgi:hypothetical protein
MASMATRTCIGSKTFGIEAHEAPIEDFPVQPSRKDGLGTMCRHHWTEYTRALAQARRAKSPFALPEPTPPQDALAPKTTTVELSPSLRASMNFAAGISRQTRRPRHAPEPIRTRAPRRRPLPPPEAGSQGNAG